jgi:hypothetical protein
MLEPFGGRLVLTGVPPDPGGQPEGNTDHGRVHAAFMGQYPGDQEDR